MNSHTQRWTYILLSTTNRCPDRPFKMGHQGRKQKKINKQAFKKTLHEKYDKVCFLKKAK